ncbi:MAG: methionine--tRNA ligase, partial [Mycoplasmataceae bacterium]|nr:methionine--tRNA ligase [Mycoplasmataceae bacterium]
MSIKKKKFYITTPIYYASGEPHIGHAFTTILADVIAKYKKLIGYDVVFLTGMDEHGQKIAEKAAENNMEPQKWVDFITDKFLDLWKKLDINNTNFIRTSSPKHKLAVQKVFSEFLIKKYIYLGQWESLYCVGCEETYTKDEAIKKEDGHLYCRIGHKLINKKEPSYFFKMSKFTDWIKKFLLNNKNFLYPKTRVNEMINSFINQGIEDLSVSRTNFKWG